MPEPVSSVAIGSVAFALILSLVQSASLYFSPPHSIQYDYDYDLAPIDLDHKIDVDIPDPGLGLSFSQYGQTSRRHSLTPTLDLDRSELLSDVPPSMHSFRSGSGHSLFSGYSTPTQATTSSIMSSPHFTQVRSRRVDTSAGFNMLLTIMGERRHGSMQ
ncbi:hypothetical protein BGZ59_004263 [Podila verticillata]|nr:hypothetical protein BGZ59_004263 [Podila verticillata]